MFKKILLFAGALCSSFFGFSQTIPNGGFESWTSHTTYNTPDNWTTMNNLTAISGVFTCLKGTPGSPGTAYLKLISKTISGGVVNGIAMCGNIDTLTLQPNGGFPCVGRPANLTGKWQHMIYGTSQGSVEVVLTRWDANTNARVTVGSGSVTLTGMAMSWANFTVPINYLEGNNADSCLIVLEASGSTPTNNDYLWVDNLGFSGTVTGLPNVTPAYSATVVYPNPTRDQLNIRFNYDHPAVTQVQLLQLNGARVHTVELGTIAAGESERSIAVAELTAGNYLLKITSGKQQFVHLVQIQ